MNNCLKCGREIQNNSKFCNYCGAPVAAAAAKVDNMLDRGRLLYSDGVNDKVKKYYKNYKETLKIEMFLLVLFLIIGIIVSLYFIFKEPDEVKLDPYAYEYYNFSTRLDMIKEKRDEQISKYKGIASLIIIFYITPILMWIIYVSRYWFRLHKSRKYLYSMLENKVFLYENRMFASVSYGDQILNIDVSYDQLYSCTIEISSFDPKKNLYKRENSKEIQNRLADVHILQKVKDSTVLLPYRLTVSNPDAVCDIINRKMNEMRNK